ncbi:MAG: MgtC/SapB family protein [Cyanobacteria bacterium J06631_2]
MDWTTFAIRLLVGFFLAVGIGIERQWLKTRAVLKTNVLVTLGSAMFVMLSIMTPGDSSPTRISAQIVSGVGFLGGGVILREGASVKGINTAATLWCAAAIGTLVGSGFLVQAYVSTVIVVGANLLLRPLVEAFKQREDRVISPLPVKDLPLIESKTELAENLTKIMQGDHPNRYSCCITCSVASEAKILELLEDFAQNKDLLLIELKSNSLTKITAGLDKEIEITAKFLAQNNSTKVENYTEIMGLIKTNAEVDSMSWQLA